MNNHKNTLKFTMLVIIIAFALAILGVMAKFYVMNSLFDSAVDYVCSKMETTEIDETTASTTSSPPVLEENPVLYDVPLSDDIQKYVYKLCCKYDLEPRIIYAIIDRESKYDPDIVGDSGRSFGLMQIQPRWHEDRMTKLHVADLFDAKSNIKVGADYLAELLDMADGDYQWALTAYNSGISSANRINCSEYAQEIIDKAEIIRTKY